MRPELGGVAPPLPHLSPSLAVVVGVGQGGSSSGGMDVDGADSSAASGSSVHQDAVCLVFLVALCGCCCCVPILV